MCCDDVTLKYHRVVAHRAALLTFTILMPPASPPSPTPQKKTKNLHPRLLRSLNVSLCRIFRRDASLREQPRNRLRNPLQTWPLCIMFGLQFSREVESAAQLSPSSFTLIPLPPSKPLEVLGHTSLGECFKCSAFKRAHCNFGRVCTSASLFVCA